MLLAVTVRGSLKLISGFPEHLAAHGWEVHVVASNACQSDFSEGVTVHSIPMRRDPSLFADIKALTAWVTLLRQVRPDLVVAGTPKAGLLGMIASWLTRVPVRIYMLRGLRLETERGWRRAVLAALEKLSAGAATQVISVSRSLRRNFVEMRLAPAYKVIVLGEGSSNGVELAFPARSPRHGRNGSIETDPRALTIGFVGRIARDKGISTLLSAYREICDRGVAAELLLVGAEEPAGIVQEELRRVGLSSVDVTWLGQVTNVDPYYDCMDILCLPSRREGFPNVVLEAAAHQVPAVVSDATGCVDSVIDGVTGVVFEVDNPRSLASKLAALAGDREQRLLMGMNARRRVEQHFERSAVWRQSEEHLRGLVSRSTNIEGE